MISSETARAAAPLLRLAISELIENEQDGLIASEVADREAVQLAQRWREIGAGITGLAEALAILLREEADQRE